MTDLKHTLDAASLQEQLLALTFKPKEAALFDA